jgi:hypothetical protein
MLETELTPHQYVSHSQHGPPTTGHNLHSTALCGYAPRLLDKTTAACTQCNIRQCWPCRSVNTNGTDAHVLQMQRDPGCLACIK